MEIKKSDSSAVPDVVVSQDIPLHRSTEEKCVRRSEAQAARLQIRRPAYNNPRPIIAADSNRASWHPRRLSVSKTTFPSASGCSGRGVSRSCAGVLDRTVVWWTELALFDEAVYGAAHESCSVAPSVSSQSTDEDSDWNGAIF